MASEVRGGGGARIDRVWREHRPFLVDLAFRMLGNISDAEDVVQEAFTRLLRVDVDQLDDVRGWLVVVVSRLSLDILRSARVRRLCARATARSVRSCLPLGINGGILRATRLWLPALRAR